MPYRLYRSLILGDGTKQNPWRPKVDDYIGAQTPGKNFWNWTSTSGIRSYMYVLVMAPDAILDSIDADSDIMSLSPRLADDAAITAWLDDTIDTFQNITTLETDYVSTAWTSSGTTNRQLLRYLLKIHWLWKNVKRLRDSDTRQFILSNLSTQVNELPQAVRDKVKTWMENKGLDTSWIGPTNTVRQVLHFVLENIDWPADGIGPMRF